MSQNNNDSAQIASLGFYALFIAAGFITNSVWWIVAGLAYAFVMLILVFIALVVVGTKSTAKPNTTRRPFV